MIPAPRPRSAERLSETLSGARVTKSMRERLEARLPGLDMTESDAIRVALAEWLDKPDPLHDEGVVALLREAWDVGYVGGEGAGGMTFGDWLDGKRGGGA